MRLAIDNWRWAGVPFYLRTGKHMSRRVTEIAIRFKPAPFAPFDDTDVAALPPNWLLLRIQPEEGIALQFEVKRPGPVVDLAAVQMAFSYDDWFPSEPNIGYETLIYDVMIGDQTLFNRADMVEETWRVVAIGAGRLGEGKARPVSQLRVRQRWPGRGGCATRARRSRLAPGSRERRRVRLPKRGSAGLVRPADTPPLSTHRSSRSLATAHWIARLPG